MDQILRDKMLEDMRKVVQIPSVSSDKENVEKALDCFLELAAGMGFHTEKLVDGQIGIVEMGEGEEVCGILVHLDVVDIGDESQWFVPPYDVTVKDGKVYGRGVLDDKGSAIMSLYAMKAVLDSGKPLHKKIRMIIGTQEEVEWVDMYEYVAKYDLPDYAFTPDGHFPIGNVEKGYYDLVMNFPYGEADLQPAGDLPKIVAIECGVASNIVPEKCTVILSNGEIVTADGMAAHTCLPDKGVNALFKMKEKLDAEYKLADNTCKKVIDLRYDYFNDFVGAKLGLAPKEEYYLGEYIHKNMYTPSVIRTTEDGVDVVVNGRFAYTTTKEEIQTAFEAMCEAYGGKIVGEDFLPAVFVSREAPYIQELAKAYENVTGTEAEFVIDYGASYCKAMPNMVSFGPIFPDEVDMCHQANEYMSLDKIEQMYDILKQCIGAIATSEASMKPVEA